jgi:hypothetical protein
MPSAWRLPQTGGVSLEDKLDLIANAAEFRKDLFRASRRLGWIVESPNDNGSPGRED